MVKGKRKKTQAIAVIIHGLNTKPSKMDTLAKFLNQNGIQSLRVGLSGHQNNLEQMKEVNAKKWQDEVFHVFKNAQQLAKSLKVPLYFVGYSLGCLLNLNLMANSSNEVRYDKLVLFAPPISLKWYVYFIKWFYVFGDSFILPSYAPESYGVNAGTTIAAYRALFDTLSSLRQAGFKTLNTPTLVIMDPEDELVSFNGVKFLIKKNGLSNWQISEVNNLKSKLKRTYHHLIIDEMAVGNEQWNQINKKILEFLHIKT